MSFSKIIVLVAICLVVILIIMVSLLIWSIATSPQQIAPAEAVWSLSPKKDKLVYQTQDTIVVIDSLTQEQHTFTDCNGGVIWLNDYMFICENFIIDTNEWDTTPIKRVNPKTVDIGQVQNSVDVIYTNTKYDNILVIFGRDYKNNPNNNYIIHAYPEQKEQYEEQKQILFEVTTPITMPKINSYFMRDGQPVYSPDGAYYYQTDGDTLTVYDASTHQPVTSYRAYWNIFPPSGFLGSTNCSYNASWDATSRAIYFQIDCFASTGFLVVSFSQSGKSPLYRLKVR